MKYAFLVDSDKCIGCRGCSMACKNFNKLEPDMAWRQVYPLSTKIYPHRERAFLSLACNHCEDPACLRSCPTKSYQKRDDGIVVHTQETCIGCGNCVRSCPYGVPKINPVKRLAEKCSMCYERIDAGLLPACVQACPVDALTLIDLDSAEGQELARGTTQYPEGFPRMERLNPATRFIVARQPVLSGGK